MGLGRLVATPVVLDANALILPFERRVRLDPELERLLGDYEPIVPEAVLKELATLAATGKGATARNAKAALTLATRYKFVDSSGRGDAGVLQVARALDAVLLTNDKELRALARSEGLRTIYLRGKGHLELDDPAGRA